MARAGAPARRHDASLQPDRVRPVRPDDAPRVAEADGVATGLGGVFFLVNPLRQLRALEPERPWWELADQLGWWTGIGTLARSLLPPDHPGAGDAVWDVLALLGGDRSATPRAPAPHRRRWLDGLRPVMVTVLTDALGCRADDLPAELIERRARIVHDRTHVDVHYPLATATVAVRRAGFDRDPAWVPELGRVVTFHFDDGLGGGPG
jgi:hypothetical protein